METDYLKKVEEHARKKTPGYFIEKHVVHVVKHAEELCSYYPEADKEVTLIGAWLHDVIYPLSGYSKDDHHTASAEEAKTFLKSINYDSEKIKKVIHCIEAHRTSKPPEPESIEAKIVASSDNLAHFTRFSDLSEKMGFEKAYAKLERDLKCSFMLPEAIQKATKIKKEIDAKSE